MVDGSNERQGVQCVEILVVFLELEVSVLGGLARIETAKIKYAPCSCG